jgi:hypothetical protein
MGCLISADRVSGSQARATFRSTRLTSHDGRAKQLLAIVFVEIAILIAIIGISVALGAETQPFKPVRELTTWYTDWTPIDIEIVGSSSMLPESHHLEPERTLRFRLERAYVVAIIAKSEPGFDIVDFSFDMETGLPESLFFAVANKGKFHEDLASVPILSNAERVRRTLNISISSDASAVVLEHTSEVYRKKCIGAPLGGGLSIFEWKDRLEYCQQPVYPNEADYVADYDSGLALRIVCQEERFPGTGCKLPFPFKGFAVELSFHRDHLRDWRMMIDKASEFLLSKEYH